MMTNFDFDEWVKLYEANPAEYERKRAEVLTQEILKAPVGIRNDLRLLQMQCDVLHNTLDPMDATVEMTKMMKNKLSELKTPLTQLRAICEDIADLK
jgi:hypothetical protein